MLIYVYSYRYMYKQIQYSISILKYSFEVIVHRKCFQRVNSTERLPIFHSLPICIVHGLFIGLPHCNIHFSVKKVSAKFNK